VKKVKYKIAGSMLLYQPGEVHDK